MVGKVTGKDDLEALRELLRSGDDTKSWLESLDRLGRPAVDVTLPAPDELASVLLGLAVPHEDIDDLVALRPNRERSPALWWLLERCVQALIEHPGAAGGSAAFPPLPEGLGALQRFFYVYVFLAALPHVQAFHRRRQIPEDVSRLTLADLGRNMAVYRRRQGHGGMGQASWLARHFRGAIYALGRLQFERARLGERTGQAVAAAGLPYGPGDPALAVHIPAFYGPMTPRACDESFALARAFFARHFPEERYEVAVCNSWLLDEQLREYLPEEANIIQFQRRFQRAYRPDVGDAVILRFVFGRTMPTLDGLDALPRRTTLERAIVDHLQAGRHWHGGAGWLRL